MHRKEFLAKSILVLDEFLAGRHHECGIECADVACARSLAGGEIFGHAAQELTKIGKRAERKRRRERLGKTEMTQEAREPKGIAKMVGQMAEPVTLLAVDEIEPGKLAAESRVAIVLQGTNHGIEASALDSLRKARYSHVMSIAYIARYKPARLFSRPRGAAFRE